MWVTLAEVVAAQQAAPKCAQGPRGDAASYPALELASRGVTTRAAIQVEAEWSRRHVALLYSFPYNLIILKNYHRVGVPCPGVALKHIDNLPVLPIYLYPLNTSTYSAGLVIRKQSI